MFALLMMTGCDGVRDDFEGPSEQWEGLVVDEDQTQEPDGRAGDIDTGRWEDPVEDTPEDPSCDESDLLFVAEIHGENGAAAQVFPKSEELSFVGRMINTCEWPIRLTTDSDCLVQRWEIQDDGDISIAVRPDCSDGSRDWVLGPGDELFQTSNSRILPTGTYTLTVRFNLQPYVAKREFTIE
jgi:hypothetical protein